jgi:hypothetical protein
MGAPAVLNVTGVNFNACPHVLGEIHFIRTIANYGVVMNFANAINIKCGVKTKGGGEKYLRNKLLINSHLLD